MKGLVILLALVGMFDDDSDFTRTRGGLLVTGASIFNVNRADKITPEGVLKVFSEAFIAKHKFQEGRSLLVFQKGARIGLRKASAKDVADGSELHEGDYYVDQKDFMQSLKTLGLQMEQEVRLKVPVSEIKKVDDMVNATKTNELRKLVLVGNSMMNRVSQATVDTKNAEDETKVATKAPIAQQAIADTIESRVSDHSLLIEWGNPETVEKEKAILLSKDANSDSSPIIESRIYDLHYDKLPLRAEILLSEGDAFDETKPIQKKKIDPLFLVRSKFETQKPAYLMYISAAERDARRIVALEVSSLNITETGQKFDFEVDAACFADQVIRAELGKELSFPSVSSYEDATRTDSSAMSHFSVRSVGEGANAQKRLQLKFSFNKPAPGTDLTTASADAVRVFFESKDENESWSVRLGTAEDVTPPFGNNLKIYVYDSNCNGYLLDPKAVVKEPVADPPVGAPPPPKRVSSAGVGTGPQRMSK